MNNDLISRSDIRTHISELILVYSGTELNNVILNAIDNAPTKERPKGEWEDMSWFYRKPIYKCTHCNHILEIGYYSYCPKCGADMRGEKKEGEDND